MYDLKAIIFILFNMNIFIAILVIAIYLFEKTSNFKIIFSIARSPKSPYDAKGVAALYSSVYFLINAFGFYWHIKNNFIELNFITGTIWIIFISSLSVFINKISFKMQVIDPNKPDS